MNGVRAAEERRVVEWSVRVGAELVGPPIHGRVAHAAGTAAWPAAGGVWPVAPSETGPPGAHHTGWFGRHRGRSPWCLPNHLTSQPDEDPAGPLSSGDRRGCPFALRAKPQTKVETKVETKPRTNPQAKASSGGFAWGFRRGRARFSGPEISAIIRGRRSGHITPLPGCFIPFSRLFSPAAATAHLCEAGAGRTGGQ